MNKWLTRLKYQYRNSAFADGYWKRRHDRIARSGRFSQHGEDAALAELFPDGRTYIDIGANHPFLLSNTYALYQAGWRGVTVEPLRSLWRMHRKWRPEDIAINAAVGSGASLHIYEMCPDVLSTISKEAAEHIERNGQGIVIGDYDVPVISGAEIVDRHLGGAASVDVLSIDVEAFELPVLQSFDFERFRPKSVIIEHFSFVPDADSSRLCDALLKDFGYRVERLIGTNSIYVL